MPKQPVKKKTELDLNPISALKRKMGMPVGNDVNIASSNADKKMEWLLLPKAYEEAVKLPGIPLGYVTTICGHSNTGKSTMVNCAIAAAQRQGLCPVIYDTENNFDFNYAISCGMQAEPVYGDVEVVDEETGEVTTVQKIVNYDGNFIYFDSTLLAEQYGLNCYDTDKQAKVKRKRAVLEDIAYSINELIKMQEDGEFEQGFVFIWDSVGSITSYKNYKSSKGNNMFDAGAISQAFNTIVNSLIPSSRKMSCPYTNTLILINKVWLDGVSNPIGIPSLELKGGKTFTYATRLMIQLGGSLKAATKKLNATSKGVQYSYGVETKIKTIKNQLPAPWTVSGEGTMCCVPNGLVSPDDLDTWKKENMGEIIKQLTAMSPNTDMKITEEDIKFGEEEAND